MDKDFEAFIWGVIILVVVCWLINLCKADTYYTPIMDYPYW